MEKEKDAKDFSKELLAMNTLDQALSGLEDTELVRVLGWANSKFGKVVTPTAASSQRSSGQSSSWSSGAIGSSESETFAEFFAQASPKTESEKALVAFYWMQFRENKPDLDSQSVNTELKNLGHAIANITRALDANMNQKPALIVQTRKEGISRQARKKYKLTDAGRRIVEGLTQRATGESA